MTWFSLTSLVFLTPYVWDRVAHFVRKGWAGLVALSESGRSAARPDSGTSASAEPIDLSATEQVPDFWKAA